MVTRSSQTRTITKSVDRAGPATHGDLRVAVRMLARHFKNYLQYSSKGTYLVEQQ